MKIIPIHPTYLNRENPTGYLIGFLILRLRWDVLHHPTFRLFPAYCLLALVLFSVLGDFVFLTVDRRDDDYDDESMKNLQVVVVLFFELVVV